MTKVWIVGLQHKSIHQSMTSYATMSFTVCKQACDYLDSLLKRRDTIEPTGWFISGIRVIDQDGKFIFEWSK